MAELRVLSNYEAEYGRNSGAIINIVTKSGTNALHGSAIEFFRSGKMGARNYFNPASDPKNPFNNNQYGGSLGGPIVKDKTFFYVDYEGQRENGAQSGRRASLMRRSRTSGVFDRRPRRGGKPGDHQFVGTQSVADAKCRRRERESRRNLQGATATAAADNLATSTHFFNRVDSLIAKIDHNFNANNMLTGRYYFGDSNQSFPFAQLGGGLLPGFNSYPHARATDLTFLGEGGECQSVE